MHSEMQNCASRYQNSSNSLTHPIIIIIIIIIIQVVHMFSHNILFIWESFVAWVVHITVYVIVLLE